MTVKTLDITGANGTLFRFVLLPDGVSTNYDVPTWTETGGNPRSGMARIKNGGQPTVEVYDNRPGINKATADGNYIAGGFLAATLPGGVPFNTYPGGMPTWTVDAATMTTVRAWLDKETT